MRIYHKRYVHDRRRYDLALRFIAHNVRTQVIMRWTGLPLRPLKGAIRSYGLEQKGKRIRRRSGQSFSRVSFFFEAKHRKEVTALAGLCVAMKAVPPEPMANAPKELPGVYYGERICAVHEFHRQYVPDSKIPLERTMSMVMLLAQGALLRTAYCSICGGIMLIEPTSLPPHICCFCQDRRSKKYLPAIAEALTGIAENDGNIEERRGAQLELSLLQEVKKTKT